MQPLLLETNNVNRNTIFVKEINVKNLSNPVHFHKEYEMVLITKSTGRRIVGDSVENFEAGDLVLIGPNLPHVMYNDKSYYEPGNEQMVTAIVTYFRMDWLNEEFINSKEIPYFHELLKDINRGIRVYGETHKQVVLLLEQLLLSTGLRKILHLLSIITLLSETREYKCLSSIGYTNPHSQKDVQRISRIYTYIMDNFSEDISLETAATLANMTTSAFCKYFKGRTQKTFTHFVNEVRIGHACKLLFDDNLSMTEICFQSGFNNLTNFNRNFKQYTTVSPSEFKRNLKI
ncbi:AraC family transcriptional regulator [Pedobacter gandavensis]|uniref:Helix-turn-helix domain-containing protein n=1 Tax=Pedobacter gandavensis TaxID=2679963 RepID=A0ABR6ETH8_9SPHI|nr:AraC family transcriptional regulator [Pedobacter gandavensis]MBB2148564.1 helix-turn-helix domain-containing protein [Pedobacter gandavensis]